MMSFNGPKKKIKGMKFPNGVKRTRESMLCLSLSESKGSSSSSLSFELRVLSSLGFFFALFGVGRWVESVGLGGT